MMKSMNLFLKATVLICGSVSFTMASAQGMAKVDLKTHDVGNVWLSVTNYGQFGSGEFPANSDIEYLFYGGIWIGALVQGDTMVSVATDGWMGSSPGGVREAFWPGWEEKDTILVRSVRVGTPAFDSAAVSEQDFIASYSDTSVLMTAMREFLDHKPMGIKVTQKSYAWSNISIRDFIIFNFKIENVSYLVGEPKTFNQLYMGIYIDGDVGHKSISGYYTDDITGFMRVSPDGDTVNVAWIKDNDGDEGMTPGVSGCCPLYPPPEIVSYNWWDPPHDWGPSDTNNPNDFGHTPEIPSQQYRVMSNGNIDPDQTESNPPSEIDPSGMDSRYLLSYGPYTVEPGSSLVLTMAYVCGQPEPGDTNPPFDDLVRNVLLARELYNNNFIIHLKGDANWDGQINILDVILAVNILLDIVAPTEYEAWSTDCDGDGVVTFEDVLGIVNVILGIGECGP